MRSRKLSADEGKMDVAQSASFLTSMTYEVGVLEYVDIPRTCEPVWILGRQYSTIYDYDDIKLDILSKLWFTYRKGFAPIGGTGPSYDTGWGCMLRCGQMMLAQSLIRRHLPTGWTWNPERYDPKYYEILRMFLDKKVGNYSIHQIASMGMSEGKAVGEWFGPNTVAQVLRKLAVYDEWSNLVVHVALDNTVIIDDIRTLCLADRGESPPKVCSTCGKPQNKLNLKPAQTSNSQSNTATDHCPRSNTSGERNSLPNGLECPVCQCSSARTQRRKKEKSASKTAGPEDRARENGYDVTPDAKPETGLAAVRGLTKQIMSQFKLPWGSDYDAQSESTGSDSQWRPLLLIIPLRLGLSEINPVYINALKTCLQLKHSVGIIGGKPNHAHYFIGYVEDELLYLDPHTTQYVADVTQPDETDQSYHCNYVCRMKIDQLDPSIALGFFCGTKSDFQELCVSIEDFIIQGERTPMFELHHHRPAHWPPFEPYSPDAGPSSADFTLVEQDRQFDDSDEDFELL